MSWQPIETAPKDGTVLTFGTLHPDGDYETPACQISWWHDESGTWVSSQWGSHSPTHWQHLPDPPS